MHVCKLLRAHSDEIINEATQSTSRANLKHYGPGSSGLARQRFQTLFALVLDSLETRDVSRLFDWAEAAAKERFFAGCELYEIQLAINVLEEAIWTRLLKEIVPIEFPEAIGAVSTVLGMGKDALARFYVSLATGQKTPALDLGALFKGTQPNPS